MHQTQSRRIVAARCNSTPSQVSSRPEVTTQSRSGSYLIIHYFIHFSINTQIKQSEFDFLIVALQGIEITLKAFQCCYVALRRRTWGCLLMRSSTQALAAQNSPVPWPASEEGGQQGREGGDSPDAQTPLGASCSVAPNTRMWSCWNES